MSEFERIIADLPEGVSWRYEVHVNEGRVRHIWAIVGDRGGIHVNAWRASSPDLREWYGGVECHSPTQMYGDEPTKPDHEHCWLLDKPCWHDGSSLQFSEQIAPELPRDDRPMDDFVHGYVLRTMLHRYKSWLPASVDRSPKGEDPEGLHAKHESAVTAKPADAQTTEYPDHQDKGE